jgi:hypothetical protein
MAIDRPIRIRDGVAFKKREPALRTGPLSNLPSSFAPLLLEARSRPPGFRLRRLVLKVSSKMEATADKP